MRFDHYRLCVKIAQRTCQIIDNDIFIFLKLRYLLRSLCFFFFFSDTCNSVCCFSYSLSLLGGKREVFFFFFAEFIKYWRERCLTRKVLFHLAWCSGFSLAFSLLFFNTLLHRFSLGSDVLEVFSRRKMAGASGNTRESRVG